MSKKHKSSRKSPRPKAKRSGKRTRPGAGKRGQARAGASARASAEDPPSGSASEGSESPPAIVDKTAELAERAWKYADNDELRDELKNLSREEAAMFVLLVEKQLKRRRLQLIGYAISLFAFLAGMFVALWLYANRDPGEFVGWAFLIPFTLVAASLLIFGRLAKKA